jgi:hypothetical protein
LPAVIQQNIRIFYYNYDSYWKRDAVHTRLPNLGDELLEHIRGIRSSDAVSVSDEGDSRSIANGTGRRSAAATLSSWGIATVAW